MYTLYGCTCMYVISMWVCLYLIIQLHTIITVEISMFVTAQTILLKLMLIHVCTLTIQPCCVQVSMLLTLQVLFVAINYLSAYLDTFAGNVTFHFSKLC